MPRSGRLCIYQLSELRVQADSILRNASRRYLLEDGVCLSKASCRKRAWRPVRQIDVGALDRAPPILPIDAVLDLGIIVARFLDCSNPIP